MISVVRAGFDTCSCVGRDQVGAGFYYSDQVVARFREIDVAYNKIRAV
jgi:hypothetical protein